MSLGGQRRFHNGIHWRASAFNYLSEYQKPCQERVINTQEMYVLCILRAWGETFIMNDKTLLFA